MEQAQEYIVTKEIISHLSRFLKNDSASGGTCYYKPIFFLILISTKMHFLLVFYICQVSMMKYRL